MPKPTKEPEVLTREDFRSLLGEGFHTAFRKATYSPEAREIWLAIDKLPRDEWGEVLSFVMECFPDKAFIVPKRSRRR